MGRKREKTMGSLPCSLHQRVSFFWSKGRIFLLRVFGASVAETAVTTVQVQVHDWGLLGTEPGEVKRRKKMGILPHPLTYWGPLF